MINLYYMSCFLTWDYLNHRIPLIQPLKCSTFKHEWRANVEWTVRERWTNDDRKQSGVWPLSKFRQQLKGVRTGKAEAIAITKLMMNIRSKQDQRFVWIFSQVTVILRLKYVDLVFSIVLYTNLSWNNCLNINALNSGAH